MTEPAGPSRPSRVFALSVRVTFSDTDAAGIIYYGRYFTYFEQGFLGLLKEAGYDYYRLSKEMNLLFPAAEAHCRYLAPARYDDLLDVRTWLSEARGAHLRFETEIHRAGVLIARGSTRHACVTIPEFKITRIPAALLKSLQPYTVTKTPLE